MVRCSKARLADWALAALFVVHFIVIYPSLLSIIPRSPWEVTEQWNKFGTAAFVSVLFGLGWAGAIWKMTTDTATATKAFTMSQVAASVLFATHALLLALNGVWSLAILLGAIAFADYVWMQHARERITFLVEVLRLVQALVQSRLREIAALSMLLAGLQFAFILLWVAAITRVIQLPSTGGVATVMLLMLLSFRWTTGMIKHGLTHVVAVQVTHALKRAAEASRFGAQITPRLRSLTEAADSEEDVTVLLTAPSGAPHPSGTPGRAGAFSSADVAAAVGGRPHHRPGDVGAEWYLRSTHKYAHVLVATQDRSWCAAAASGWAELQRSGVDGIIDDDVTDRMLLFGGYVGGAVLSLLLGTTVQTPDMATWLWSAALVFAIGFTGVTLPLTVLEASTSTLFVAFAQVPETLAACHPILYHRFERLTEVYAHTRGREALFAIGRAPRDDLVDRL